MNTLSSAENTNPFEELYQKIEKLNLLELEKLTNYIFDLRKNKLSTVLSEQEQLIIEQINRPLPKDIQERYNFLRDKKSSDSLDQTQYDELLTLTSYIESYDNKRLSLFIELSELRNEPLNGILEQFDIKSAEYDS
ncbi:hypothetical protein V9L05_16840 [Bernardetia sp. Wsw4-3y2]|uniref:hypothetical protein n=1 Tax=Bernardetia sp. Wsw4-3y2 TaxID=3127471 RepID=UPI0030D39E96